MRGFGGWDPTGLSRPVASHRQLNQPGSETVGSCSVGLKRPLPLELGTDRRAVGGTCVVAGSVAARAARGGGLGSLGAVRPGWGLTMASSRSLSILRLGGGLSLETLWHQVTSRQTRCSAGAGVVFFLSSPSGSAQQWKRVVACTLQEGRGRASAADRWGRRRLGVKSLVATGLAARSRSTIRMPHQDRPAPNPKPQTTKIARFSTATNSCSLLANSTCSCTACDDNRSNDSLSRETAAGADRHRHSRHSTLIASLPRTAGNDPRCAAHCPNDDSTMTPTGAVPQHGWAASSFCAVAPCQRASM